MKINYFQFYFFALLLTFSISCGTLPIDTYNKKVAAFEISYNEALKTAERYLNSATVPGVRKDEIRNAIKTTAQARNAMKLAEQAGNFQDAEAQLNAAQAALLILRGLAEEGKL